MKKYAIEKKSRPLKALITIFELVDFGIRVRYLFDTNAKFYSIYYLFARNKAIYADPERLKSQGWLKSITSNYWIFILFFVFKSLEWGFNRRVQQDINLDIAKEAVEAPRIEESPRERLVLCPICGGRIDVPAMVPTSNFAYCFECLSNFVESKQACPMSGLTLELADVKRIYIN
jgi:hypothetical protein